VPSIFGHAIVGTAAARLASPVKSSRKLYILSLLSSIIPDIDVVTFAFGVQYESFFGHRGILHSIVFAGVAGFFGSAVYLKSFKFRSIDHLRWMGYFTLVTLSHPILDAMTKGGRGVAFFSPFNNYRYFSYFRPIFVSPLSVQEFFSLVGLRILISEVLFLGVPCFAMILLSKVCSRAFVSRLAYLSASILLVGYFFGIVRQELISSVNGANVYKIEPTLLMKGIHGLSELPTENLPGKKLIVNYNDLVRYQLINTTLVPSKVPWAGSYFPVWLGGAAGRWQEPYLQGIWRSLWGESFISKSELLELLHGNSSQLLRFSPTEKYDIAVGDYYLSATRAESVVRGRGSININSSTPVWSGYCHSIGLAALFEKEPTKEVTVLNPDGHEVTFYPNDLKALLGIAYLFPSSTLWDLGNRCQLDGPSSDACIDVNPASLVIAIANLIGLAKTSFLMSKEPFNWVSNGPVRRAEIKVVNPPYYPADRSSYFEVDDLFIKYLVDVEIRLTVSRITALPNDSEEEDLTYRATIGLDSKMNLVGGRWEDPFHHPDFVWGSYKKQNEPALFGAFIKGNVKIEWAILKALVEQSASSVLQAKPILISQLSSEPVMHGLSFSSEVDGVSGRISYLRYADPIEIYGHIEGKNKDSFTTVELIVEDGKKLSSSALILATVQQRFFKLRASDSIENREGVRLRIHNGKNSIEFQIPPKKKFESRLDSKAAYP
jgi:inner membrane protein